ncbi:protein spinster homolog 1-like isoform X2 [Stegodyphus dumicola]|uniref:protein spinster homolog 1-like isoform X2 n=1 Tax=Stegodyphus dumicola TaxID=202533 RepID=UPI0015A85AA5|nr:protein spinster homolog 1-like isoform X2 [Stegodyphus dumicola]
MPAHTNLAYSSDDGFENCARFENRDPFHNSTCRNGMPASSQEMIVSSRSKKRYVSVAILCFINLINYMDRFTIAGILDNVQKFYSIGNTEAGLLQTSFIVSYMVMAPVFGYLGDRYSRKIIIAAGVTFWSITTLLGSFIPSHLFGIFIFLRALVGTGEASYSTIAPTIIADLFSKDRRSKMLAVFYFAIPVGSGLGYIIGDQITAAMGEWQWALRITPGLGLLSVVLTLLYVRDPPRGEAEGGSNLRSTTLYSDLSDLCKTKSFVFSTLGFTSVTFATGALAWFGPKYMELAIKQRAVGSPPQKAALIFGFITCVAGIVGVLIGSISSQYLRRLNARADPLICAFGVLASVPLVYAGVVIADSNLTLSWILIFLGEVCLCVNWTIVADMLLYVIIPTRRSIAEAVQILVSHALGDASSPYVIGIVSDAIIHSKNPSIDEFLSLQYALYIPTGVLIIGGFFFFLTAVYIEKDKAKCSLVTHAENNVEKSYNIPVKSAIKMKEETGGKSVNLLHIQEIRL